MSEQFFASLQCVFTFYILFHSFLIKFENEEYIKPI